jgi:hypothetical protein
MTFLEQLQQSAGLLSDNIANSSPFGNYTPMEASDFINTPFGQPIAQNRFEGNQFLMPDLSGSTYTPGNFSLAPGAGFNFGNMGTYNPGAFNQFYQAPMTSPAIARTTTRTGGQGEGRDRAAQMAADRALRNEIAQYGFQIPGYEEPTLPGLLGIVESVIDNLDREARIANIMRDVKASKDFGVNMFGLGTSYRGSSGIDRDPADFGRPTTGPSARDSDLGKSTGGRGPSTTSGRGQDTSGRGQAGGARGGDNPGNTGGTSRF